jgi:hypothetical protein
MMRFIAASTKDLKKREKFTSKFQVKKCPTPNPKSSFERERERF